MKVFIEQPGDRLKKNIFDKETGEYAETIDFHITYPYAYGYILNTKASDGDELDCYIITDAKLETSAIVECEPIGMVEYFEDSQADHKIFAILKGESRTIDDEVKKNLLNFDKRYFEGQPSKNTRVGEFLGKAEALEEIRKSSLK